LKIFDTYRERVNTKLKAYLSSTYSVSNQQSELNKMESGDLSLEESLKYFEKGVKLHRQCHSALTDAEHRVNILSEEDNYSKEKSFEDL
jgi:exodeoxyribonuclease VII small subunit